MLPLGTETRLAQERLCARTAMAVALSLPVLLKLRGCCEAEPPRCLNADVDFSISSCMCICCWEMVSECFVSQMFCRSFPYLYPYIKTSFGVRSGLPALSDPWGSVRSFCNLRDGAEQVNHPAACLMCPDGAVRKWKCNPRARGEFFLDCRVGKKGC